MAARLSLAQGLDCEIVCTDFGDEGILACLERNFERNLGGYRGKGRGREWSVLGFAWGSDPTPLLCSPTIKSPSVLISDDPVGSIPSEGEEEEEEEEGDDDDEEEKEGSSEDVKAGRPFDLILCSDLLFFTPSHGALLASILALLGTDPWAEAHFTAGMHGGRGAIDRFVRLAEQGGECQIEDRGVVLWDQREEMWKSVEKEDEGGEGRVWWGVLRRRPPHDRMPERDGVNHREEESVNTI